MGKGQTIEKWLPVRGYEDSYIVSSLGRVKSLPRRDRLGREVQGRELSTPINSQGYPHVNLWSDGVGKVRTVHSIVAEAFLGPPPEGKEVRHLNGNREDNRLTNLKYGTRSENMVDAVDHRTNWNTAKTHCPRGHEYSEQNLKPKNLSNGRTGRACRACTQERTAAHMQGRPFDPQKADEVYMRNERRK